ncbi:hypothetical protein GCM10027082_24180 [Comamonas humi]
MPTQTQDKKKATSWVAQWKARRSSLAHERAERDRGEWGYIPPGCLFVPKRWLVTVNVCLVVMMLSNAIMLAVQAYSYFEKKSHAAKTVATAPNTAAASAAK